MSRRISLPCPTADAPVAWVTARQWPECSVLDTGSRERIEVLVDAPSLNAHDLACLAETVERAVALAIRQHAVVRRVVG